MDRIDPYLLWVGHAGDGRNDSRIFQNGIKAVVQIAHEELPFQPPRDLIYLRFPLDDGGGDQLELIKLAIINLSNLIQWRVPTLICCACGMSRSPAIAAAALSVANGESPESSLSRVARFRPTDVSPGFWSEILMVLSSLPRGLETSDHQIP